MTCSACGSEASDSARFCSGCGRALHALDDQRRVVTVLFADLVGFTSLSERSDPERVKNLVDGCFDRLAADVTAFGGQVDKIVGDAMVALFGAPVAHEDDAERAVRAALRMQETIAEDSSALDDALQIRIGVNTGEVLVGAMRAAGSVTAMGDVVNTASRLQTSARPGEVLVGPATHASTSGAIAYEARGRLAAKGRDEPVETWRALAPTSAPGFRARRLDVPLVGRDHEIGMLRHAVASAIDRERALLVLLMGDVGMGKSRLSDEASSWAQAVSGANVRQGRCLPYGEANIWWPVAEALRDGFGLVDGLDREQTRDAIRGPVMAALGPRGDDTDRVVDGLLTLLGHEPTVEPGLVRSHATFALTAYLGGLSDHHPLLIQVSDLHWADQAVLDLIDDVMTAVEHRPIVMVATARPALLDQWTPRTGRHNTLVLHLDPLGREESAQLLDHLVGAPVPPSVAEVILNRSGGNPFFLEELVPMLATVEDWHGADRLAELPDTLRGLVAARLDDLDPWLRAVVQNASVIGHHGPVDGLQEMGDQLEQGHDVVDALERLVSAEIMEVADHAWSFRSDLVREVAYQTITKAERARCHLGIAHYLERVVATRRPRPVSVVYQIAHHYGAAVALTAELGAQGGTSGVPSDLADRARRWVVEAAERARRDQALPTAARLYTEAIHLAPAGTGVTPADLARLHVGRAAISADSWDLRAARRDIDQVSDVIDHDPALRAEVLVVQGGIEQKEGDLDAAVASLGAAMEQYQALGDEAGRADALRQLGMVQIFGGRFDEAQSSASEALTSFDHLGNRAGQAWANQNLAWIAFVSGRIDEADVFVEAAATIFAELHDERGMAWTNGLLGWLRFQQGEVGEAERLGADVLERALADNDPWASAMMTLLLASIRLWSGHVDEAIDLAADGLRRFESIGDLYGTGQGLAVLGRSRVMAGQVGKGFELLARGADLRADADQVGPEPGQWARSSYAAASLQVGEPERIAGWPEGVERHGPTARDELTVLQGLLALQLGDLAAASIHLTPGAEPATDPNLLAAQALYAVASGVGDAGTLAAEVARCPRATYLDRVLADVAVALQAVRRGTPDVAFSALDSARSLVADTGDRIAPVVIGLAEAAVAGAAGRADADDLAAAVEALATRRGIEPVGWRRIIGAALAAEPAPV